MSMVTSTWSVVVQIDAFSMALTVFVQVEHGFLVFVTVVKVNMSQMSVLEVAVVPCKETESVETDFL